MYKEDQPEEEQILQLLNQSEQELLNQEESSLHLLNKSIITQQCFQLYTNKENKFHLSKLQTKEYKHHHKPTNQLLEEKTQQKLSELQ